MPCMIFASLACRPWQFRDWYKLWRCRSDCGKIRNACAGQASCQLSRYAAHFATKCSAVLCPSPSVQCYEMPEKLPGLHQIVDEVPYTTQCIRKVRLVSVPLASQFVLGLDVWTKPLVPTMMIDWHIFLWKPWLCYMLQRCNSEDGVEVPFERAGRGPLCYQIAEWLTIVAGAAATCWQIATNTSGPLMIPAGKDELNTHCQASNSLCACSRMCRFGFRCSIGHSIDLSLPGIVSPAIPAIAQLSSTR